MEILSNEALNFSRSPARTIVNGAYYAVIILWAAKETRGHNRTVPPTSIDVTGSDDCLV